MAKPTIKGLTKLISVFSVMKKKGKDASKASATVGFTQKYALPVHENLDAHHEVGEARYLANAAEENKKQVGKNVAKIYKRTRNMNQSLAVGALLIQRKAQEKTPVDTGALKASAFTVVTKDENQAAAAAFAKSERIRKAKKKS